VGVARGVPVSGLGPAAHTACGRAAAGGWLAGGEWVTLTEVGGKQACCSHSMRPCSSWWLAGGEWVTLTEGGRSSELNFAGAFLVTLASRLQHPRC